MALYDVLRPPAHNVVFDMLSSYCFLRFMMAMLLRTSGWMNSFNQ